MALQTNISIDVFGEQVLFEGAYFKVVNIHQFNKVNGCEFDVLAYRSKTHAEADAAAIYSVGLRFPYNENFEDSMLNECYTFMKTLDAFKDAIDC